MSDAPSPSGVMLRRAFMLLIGCSGAAYVVSRVTGDVGDGAGPSKVATTPQPPARRAQNDPEPLTTDTFHAQQGQFYVPGSVNGYPINFLVDTGATRVALTPEDAKLLGFNLATLTGIHRRTRPTA